MTARTSTGTVHVWPHADAPQEAWLNPDHVIRVSPHKVRGRLVGHLVDEAQPTLIEPRGALIAVEYVAVGAGHGPHECGVAVYEPGADIVLVRTAA